MSDSLGDEERDSLVEITRTEGVSNDEGGGERWELTYWIRKSDVMDAASLNQCLITSMRFY